MCIPHVKYVYWLGYVAVFPSLSCCVLDRSLRPFIEQIDDIELAVNALEQSAYKIDAYSKQLGTATAL